MHHERISIDTGDAQRAAETAAGIRAIAGHEGVRVHAEGGRLTIGFSNPGLADLVHVACRAVAGLGHIVAGLFRRTPGREASALPGRP